LGARKDVTESIDEYGPLSMPPSAEAGAILSAIDRASEPTAKECFGSAYYRDHPK